MGQNDSLKSQGESLAGVGRTPVSSTLLPLLKLLRFAPTSSVHFRFHFNLGKCAHFCSPKHPILWMCQLEKTFCFPEKISLFWRRTKVHRMWLRNELFMGWCIFSAGFLFENDRFSPFRKKAKPEGQQKFGNEIMKVQAQSFQNKIPTSTISTSSPPLLFSSPPPGPPA